MHTVTSATVEPTERSIPPAIMIIVMPRAAMPTITVWTAIVRQLSRVRNRPDSRVIAPKSKMIRTSPTNGPNTVQAQPRLPRSLIAGIPCRFPSRASGHRDCPPANAQEWCASITLDWAASVWVATCMISCSVHSETGRASLRAPRAMTAIRSQIPKQLGQVRADDQDRLARGRLFADQAIDLGLGADVDAAGRLVQEQDVGPLMEQPCQCHFLLVATGKVRRDLAGAGRS